MWAWSCIDPAIDFVALSRSFGVPGRARQDGARGDRSRSPQALKSSGPMLIDVELDRAFKPM